MGVHHHMEGTQVATAMVAVATVMVVGVDLEVEGAGTWTA